MPGSNWIAIGSVAASLKIAQSNPDDLTIRSHSTL